MKLTWHWWRNQR